MGKLIKDKFASIREDYGKKSSVAFKLTKVGLSFYLAFFCFPPFPLEH